MNAKILIKGLVFMLLSGTTLFAQKNLLELIPRDALFVGTVHASSIEQKVGLKKLSEYGFVSEAVARLSEATGIAKPEQIVGLLTQPQSKGIDIVSNCYLFAETAGDKVYMSLVFRLNDPAKFKAEVQTFVGEEFSDRLSNKGNYAVILRNNLAFAWQQNHAIVSFINAQRNYADDETQESFNTRLRLSLDSYMEKLCSLSEAKSYSRHGGFADWEKTVNDAGLWLDYKQVVRLSMQNPDLERVYGDFFVNAMSGLVNSYGEMSIASDLNFEKGKIQSVTKSFLGPDMMKFSASVTKNKANARIMKYIDGEQAAMYMIGCISPEGIYEGWKNLLGDKAGPLKPTVDDVFGIAEIFMDEKAAFNFLKGDFFYAVNGTKTFETVDVEYVYNEATGEYEPVQRNVKKQIPLIVVGFSYGNKEDMMKFIRIILKSGFMTEEKKNLYKIFLPGSPETVYIKLDKGLLLMGNDAERLAGKKKYRPMSKSHKNFLKSDFHTAYLNPGKLLEIAASTDASMQNKDLKEISKNIKDGVGDFIINSRRPKADDKFILQELTLDLKNKEENALKQIFDFMERLYSKTMKGI